MSASFANQQLMSCQPGRPITDDASQQGRELAAMPGSVRQSLFWPVGKFTIHDMPGEHEPCYLICPDGWMIPFTAHATNGVDQARAQWFADTLNAALNDQDQRDAKRLL